MKRTQKTPKRRPFDPRVDELRTIIDTSDDLVQVIAAVLELRDRTTIPTMVGGGINHTSARAHAEDIIAALEHRGLLTRQGVLL